jgi:hypothetical protein
MSSWQKLAKQMTKKQFFILVGFAGMFWASFAYAQSIPVSINGISYAPELSGISSAAGANSCNLLNSSNVSLPSSTYPVKIMVWPDGSNNGVRGSYVAVPPDCSDVPANAQSLCETLSVAFTTAVQAANNQSGFPQGTLVAPGTSVNDSTNVIHFIFDTNTCGTRNGTVAPLCTTVLDSDAVISFDLNSLNNPANSPEFTAAQFQTNNVFSDCAMAHELTHTFGLNDTYNLGGASVPGLMGNECQPNMTSWSWDPNAAAAVDWLNAQKPVIINDVDSCDDTCPSGEAPAFGPAANGGFSEICSGPASSTSIIDNAYSCNCDAGDPYCIDLSTQQTITPPPAGLCSLSGSASSTSGGSGTDCTCDGDQATCQSGTAPEGFCSSVPAGETCDCLDGSLIGGTCTDTNGNPVASPPGFTCPDASSGSSTGGHDCSSDGSCIPVESGGEYSDSTCDDQCTVSGGVAGYTCASDGSCVAVESGESGVSGVYRSSDCDDACVPEGTCSIGYISEGGTCVEAGT